MSSVMGSMGSNFRPRISRELESISSSGSWDWQNTLWKERRTYKSFSFTFMSLNWIQSCLFIFVQVCPASVFQSINSAQLSVKNSRLVMLMVKCSPKFVTHPHIFIISDEPHHKVLLQHSCCCCFRNIIHRCSKITWSDWLTF